MTSRAVIVGRTHMGPSSACVGALDLDNGEALRLFDPPSSYPAANAYSVGDIWSLGGSRRSATRPPHVEDFVVTSRRRVGHAGDLRSVVLTVVDPWVASLEETFEGCLVESNSKLYVCHGAAIPSCSTGFWVADRRFQLINKRYEAQSGWPISIPYVGLDPAPPEIAKGGLVRLSLASWFQGDHMSEERCYLQVSWVF